MKFLKQISVLLFLLPFTGNYFAQIHFDALEENRILEEEVVCSTEEEIQRKENKRFGFDDFNFENFDFQIIPSSVPFVKTQFCLTASKKKSYPLYLLYQAIQIDYLS